MHRILISTCFSWLCLHGVASAQNFTLDMSHAEANKAVGISTLGDLKVGESALVPRYVLCTKRAQIYIRNVSTSDSPKIGFVYRATRFPNDVFNLTIERYAFLEGEQAVFEDKVNEFLALVSIVGPCPTPITSTPTEESGAPADFAVRSIGGAASYSELIAIKSSAFPDTITQTSDTFSFLLDTEDTTESTSDDETDDADPFDLGDFEKELAEQAAAERVSDLEWDFQDDEEANGGRTIRLFKRPEEYHPEGGANFDYFSDLLVARCLKNTSTFYLVFPGRQGSLKADVRYQFDDDPVQSEKWSLSDSRTAAGLWNGRSAIPFLKKLARASTVTFEVELAEGVRKTTYKLGDHLSMFERLASVCNWRL